MELQGSRHFYPRPPRGGRLTEATAIALAALFLSTPSARRATKVRPVLLRVHRLFLSTPSARRATSAACHRAAASHISIHALREEGDSHGCRYCFAQKKFLSTPSARRATALQSSLAGASFYFYPRPPRGGRQQPEKGMRGIFKFLSTPSARRATLEHSEKCVVDDVISIHALREEGDVVANLDSGVPDGISIHALREEGDSKNGEKHLRFCFIIKRSAQIWKSFSKNIRKNSCDLHRTA